MHGMDEMKDDSPRFDAPRATNETVFWAEKIRALVDDAPDAGLHRHEILQALGMGKAKYAAALRYAVSSGWVGIVGYSRTARIVRPAVAPKAAP